MSDTGIRQFSCIRQVTDTGNILVTTAERVIITLIGESHIRPILDISQVARQ